MNLTNFPWFSYHPKWWIFQPAMLVYREGNIQRSPKAISEKDHPRSLPWFYQGFGFRIGEPGGSGDVSSAWGTWKSPPELWLNQPGDINTPPPEIAGPSHQGLLNHWFPLIRPAIKPLFCFGGYVIRGGPRLTMKEVVSKILRRGFGGCQGTVICARV